MRSSATALIILALGIFSFGCKKELKGEESDLYGTWARGTNPGDTVWFMKKSGKNIVRYATSVNSLMPMYDEKEYKYNDGQLSIKKFTPQTDDYFPVNSFAWVQAGEEFSITNSELYPFLSSIITFKFKKL